VVWSLVSAQEAGTVELEKQEMWWQRWEEQMYISASKPQLWAACSGLIVAIVFSQRSVSSKIFPLTNCLNLLSKKFASQEQPALISPNQGVLCDKSSSWGLGAAASWAHSTRTIRYKEGICVCRKAFKQHSRAHCPCEHAQARHSQSHSHRMLVCTQWSTETYLTKWLHYPTAMDCVIDFQPLPNMVEKLFQWGVAARPVRQHKDELALIFPETTVVLKWSQRQITHPGQNTLYFWDDKYWSFI